MEAGEESTRIELDDIGERVVADFSADDRAFLGQLVALIDANGGRLDGQSVLEDILPAKAIARSENGMKGNHMHLDFANFDEERQVLQDAVEKADSILHSLRTLTGFLNMLSIGAKNRLSRRRMQIGFAKLPDELLAIVFEFIGEDDYNSKDGMAAYNLSLVSRRFRRIANKISRLWTRISSCTHSIQGLASIISRNPIHGLSLTLLGPCNTSSGRDDIYSTARLLKLQERHEQFCKAVFSVGRGLAAHAPITNRIEHFTAEFNMGQKSAVWALRKLYSKFPNISFPVMEKLSFTLRNAEGYMDAHYQYEFIHFYRRWSMPALRYLEARNVIPSFADPSIPSALHTCHFELHYMEPDDDCFKDRDILYMTRAVAFLKSLKAIKKLDFRSHLGELDTVFMVSGGRAIYQNLTDLSLTFGRMGVGSLNFFLKAFGLPSVTTFFIDANIEPVTSLGEGVCNIFKHCTVFSRLQTLKIVLRRDLEKEIIPRGRVQDVRKASQHLSSELEHLDIQHLPSTDDTRFVFHFGGKIKRFTIPDCRGDIQGALKALDDVLYEEEGNEDDGKSLVLHVKTDEQGCWSTD